MCPLLFEIDTGTGPDIIISNALASDRPDSIWQRQIFETGIASNAKLKVFTTLTVHARMNEALTQIRLHILE